jgi:thiol-disulfide isomerase/thioredoxin
MLLATPYATLAAPPFSDVSIATAIASSEDQDRFLILNFTATWCGPCRRMQATSWSHDAVAAWVSAHAIAIRIDVDDNPDLALRYSVGTLPCVVAIRDGSEVDRVIGYKAQPKLLAWLNGLNVGLTHAQDLLVRADALAGSSNIEARYDLAEDLARAGQVALARREFSWVWEHTRGKDDWSAVRHSFMASAISQLANESPELTNDIILWREQARRHVEDDEGTDETWWDEWVALAWMTNELDDVVSWFEAVSRPRDRTSGSAPRLAPHVISGVFDILVQARRFAQAAALYPDSVARAKDLLDPLALTGLPDLDAVADPDMRVEVIREWRESSAREVADLLRALLAVHRDDEAELVADMVIRIVDYPSTRQALIRAAIDTKRWDFPAVRRWLRDLDGHGFDTRSLQRELRGEGKSP